MPNNNTVLDDAQTFFIQRAELYGTQFYIDTIPEPEPESGAETDLENFYQQIKHCQKCKLSKHRTKFVFGVGNPKASLMCVGEGPGYEEDQQGEPFVGAAGQLLNKILAAIGFERNEVYIANIVKCRPPNNREPEAEEISQCLPYLRQQIAMIQPKLLLALGKVAAQNLLGKNLPLNKFRGTVHKLGDIPVIVTYHPAALLRRAQLKRDTWEDVKTLRKYYDQYIGDKPEIAFK